MSQRRKHALSPKPIPGPQRIGDVLAGLMARRGYAAEQARSQCEDAWRNAAGEQIAVHTRPGNVRRGVLEVFVRNSAVMQELAFQKRQLLEQLARLAPEQKIVDLRFRVGAVD